MRSRLATWFALGALLVCALAPDAGAAGFANTTSPSQDQYNGPSGGTGKHPHPCKAKKKKRAHRHHGRSRRTRRHAGRHHSTATPRNRGHRHHGTHRHPSHHNSTKCAKRGRAVTLGAGGQRSAFSGGGGLGGTTVLGLIVLALGMATLAGRRTLRRLRLLRSDR